MDVRHQLEWIEDHVGRTVAKRLLEPVNDLSALVGRQPLVGNGRPGDVTAALVEFVRLVRLAASGRME